jgi:hypothetical protein
MPRESASSSVRLGRRNHYVNERLVVAAEPTFTFYTYSTGCTNDEPRWRNDGISNVFFLDIDDARQAIAEVRREFSNDPQSRPVAIHLEKIGTVPITDHALLSLLNGNIGSLIGSYEIIESSIADEGAAGAAPPPTESSRPDLFQADGPMAEAVRIDAATRAAYSMSIPQSGVRC